MVVKVAKGNLISMPISQAALQSQNALQQDQFKHLIQDKGWCNEDGDYKNHLSNINKNCVIIQKSIKSVS